MPVTLPSFVERVLRWFRVDFTPAGRPPSASSVIVATVVSVAGSLAADALLVAGAQALFPSTKGYAHFQFADYAKLTVIGVVIACLAWPAVTRISSAPRWLFARMAVAVTLVLWLPDVYILLEGQPAKAVAVLFLMHLAIALVTYYALTLIARPRPMTTSHRSRSRGFAEPLAAKVPEITLLFWVVKLLTTAAGEATSDYLGLGNVAVGGVVEIALLAIGLTWQFRVRRYQAAAYWFLAYAIAVFGTGVSDTLHQVLGLPYGVTTTFWAVFLIGVFTAWYRSEGTLSIHSIVTRRREMFYWTTVFTTFALGTAVGDFTAVTLRLGFLSSVVLFAIAIAMPAAGRALGLNAVVAFWWAYVLTRPLGASVADYVSKDRALSGAGFGDLPTAVVATLAVAGFVVFLVVTRHGIQAPAEPDRSVPRHPQPAETP